jgi:ABC-type glycerol-3-phosphate transport system substrate-binding protein
VPDAPEVPDAPPPGPPPDRYGSRPGRRAARTAALVLALVAALVAAAWFGLRSTPPIQGHDVAFRVLGDDAVEVTFDVSRTDPARPATCRVEALNASHAQVGVVTVDVPGSEHARVRLTTTVRTSERAVTGTVTACALD